MMTPSGSASVELRSRKLYKCSKCLQTCLVGLGSPCPFCACALLAPIEEKDTRAVRAQQIPAKKKK